MQNAVIYDHANRKWLRFDEPIEVHRAESLDEVCPMVAEIEQRVEVGNHWAVGFLSYEAASAFDSALVTRNDESFPKLWFGIYRQPRVIDKLENEIDKEAENLHWSPSISRREYDDAIAQIKEAIARGDTYQVNFTFRMRAEIDERFRPWDLFARLSRNQPCGYGTYLDIGDYAIASVSPELFFQLDGDSFCSRPMKGTAPRGRSLAEDRQKSEWLRHSEKNRAENVMIVDMVRNDCGRVATLGSVKVPELFSVERYPTVWQMTSQVNAQTDKPLVEILRALFPPASITGAPKPRTMQIISELESSPRRIYTGCIGFMAPRRQAQFNVAIRTVLINRRKGMAEYGIGGGIVWDSITNEEYDECLTKAQVLVKRTPEFSLLETMRWSEGEGYFLLDYHLRRLTDSAEYFDFALSLEEVRQRLDEYVLLLSGVQRIRLLVAKGGKISLQHQAISFEDTKPVRLRLARSHVNSQHVFLYHKTTHRDIYDRIRAGVEDCDDVIIFNERGEVTETSIYNLVIRKPDGSLVTPPVECGLLAGTYREFLLEQGKIREEIVNMDELNTAAGISVINSVRGIREAVVMTGSDASKIRKFTPGHFT